MSTGQTSSSFAASSPSPATASSTSMPMKIASLRIGGAPLGELRLHDLRDLGDLLRDRDAGLGEPGDLLRGRVLLALDDRAGMAEAHAGHLAHEAPRHEGDDRKLRVVVGDPLGQLGLHAAAGLGVDHDALGLLVGREERHQLRVAGADDRVAADRDGGRLAEAGGAERRGHLGGHAARAADDADGAGRVGLRRVLGRAADAAHLDDVRDDDPEAVGADDARAAQRSQLDHLRDVAARDPLGDDDDQLDAVLDRLEDGVLGERRRHGDDRAVDRPAVVLHGLCDGVEDRHAVDLAAEAAGRDAADHLGAGAVVEALARQVDGLAAGDALDDEGRVFADEDAHGLGLHRELRGLVHRGGAVGVAHAIALEDLEALLLPSTRDAEDRDLLRRVHAELEAGLDDAAGDDVDARVGHDRHHHRDLVHARLAEHELGQAAALLDRWVAADLAVVGGLAAVLANGVEERQRAAAGADDEAEVAVELGDVAGDATVAGGVDRLAGELERGRLARLAGLLVADAQVLQQRLVAPAGLVLHVHVRVERDERAVLQLPERVDLGERHVVLDEEPCQLGDDRDQLVEVRAGDAGGGDDLLGLELAERQDVREVPAPDLVGLLLGDLLDVDATDRAEDDHGLLADPVPHDAGVELLVDVGPGVDEHAARLVAVDLELEDVGGVLLGLLGRVGELHAAGLHAPAGEHLGLDDGGAADALCDLLRLGRVFGEPEVRDRDPGPLHDLAGLVFEEPHGARNPNRNALVRSRSTSLPRRTTRLLVTRSGSQPASPTSLSRTRSSSNAIWVPCVARPSISTTIRCLGQTKSRRLPSTGH